MDYFADLVIMLVFHVEGTKLERRKKIGDVAFFPAL
jgi:hypothetical protein